MAEAKPNIVPSSRLARESRWAASLSRWARSPGSRCTRRLPSRRTKAALSARSSSTSAIVDEQARSLAMAFQAGMEFVDLSSLEIPPDVI